MCGSSRALWNDWMEKKSNSENGLSYDKMLNKSSSGTGSHSWYYFDRTSLVGQACWRWPCACTRQCETQGTEREGTSPSQMGQPGWGREGMPLTKVGVVLWGTGGRKNQRCVLLFSLHLTLMLHELGGQSQGLCWVPFPDPRGDLFQPPASFPVCSSTRPGWGQGRGVWKWLV